MLNRTFPTAVWKKKKCAQWHFFIEQSMKLSWMNQFDSQLHIYLDAIVLESDVREALLDWIKRKKFRFGVWYLSVSVYFFVRNMSQRLMSRAIVLYFSNYHIVLPLLLFLSLQMICIACGCRIKIYSNRKEKCERNYNKEREAND